MNACALEATSFKHILLQPDLVSWDTGPHNVDNELSIVRVHPQFFSFMVAAMNLVRTDEVHDEPARCELDSHAKLPVLGGSAFIPSISPYSSEYKAK